MDLIYDIFMAPLEALKLKKIRKALLKKVSGRVLEIGTGTGANLPYLPYTNISHLYLSDLHLSERVRRFAFPKSLTVRLLESSLEALEIEESSLDSIVFTLVFCSVEEPSAGLNKVFRLLKPGGKIFFIEHVMPHGKGLKKVVDHVNPHWRNIAGGCNLNRETLQVIQASGFVIERVGVYLGGALVEGIGVRV